MKRTHAKARRVLVSRRPAGRLSRQRPALETIEAIAMAAKGSGPIVRLGGATEDPTKPWCPICRRHEARPMSVQDAKDARRAVRRAGLADAMAFAFSKTTILVTESNRFRICPCDLRAWRAALELYQREGARAAWMSIGVGGSRSLRGAA